MQPPETFLAPLEYDAGQFLIRAYRPGDGAAMSKAIVESYEHLKPWMPWATLEQPADESEAKVRGFAARYLLNEDYCMGIWQGPLLVGGTGFHLRVGRPGSGNAEIGMWIHGNRAGQGFGTRALKAMLTWGFTEWPWQRLVWRCDTRNVASARVAEKCGMVLEGTMRKDYLDVEKNRRDTHVYSALREEWLTSQ
jgi:RimJ/RimL family protein N-acetyltransferase